MAIISVSEYKTWAGISVSTYDSVLSVLIANAQDMMERYCGRYFEQATYTDEEYDGDGTDRIVVRNTPVTTLTAVKVRSDTSTSTIDSDLYRLDPDSGEVVLFHSRRGRFGPDGYGVQRWPGWGSSPAFADGYRNILVTYTGGYASGSIPDDLKQAAFEVVASLFASRGRDGSISSESLGNYSYTRANGTASTQDVMARVCAPFRRGGLL